MTLPRSPSPIPHYTPCPPSRRTIPHPSPRPSSRRTMPRPHSSSRRAIPAQRRKHLAAGRPSPASALKSHAPTQGDRILGRPVGLPRVCPRAVRSSALTRPLRPPSPHTIPCPPAAASGVQPPLPRKRGSAGPPQKHRGECGGVMVSRWVSEDRWMGREA